MNFAKRDARPVANHPLVAWNATRGGFFLYRIPMFNYKYFWSIAAVAYILAIIIEPFHTLAFPGASRADLL